MPKKAKCNIGILVDIPNIRKRDPLNLLKLGPWNPGYKVHTKTIKEKVDIIVKYIVPISKIKIYKIILIIFAYIFHNNKSNNKEDNMIQG